MRNGARRSSTTGRPRGTPLRLALALTFFALLAAGCVDRDDTPPPGAATDPAAASAELAPQPTIPPGPFGFGRAPNSDEILAWDIDVDPGGAGLPTGSGSVAEGDQVWRARCASCHGRNGEGVPGQSGAVVLPYDPEAPWPPFPRTVGNYWPYATTLFDYVRRAMPANAPGSMTPDEVYAVVAWMLHRNEIVPADAVMDAESLPDVEMPARGRFVLSDEAP